MRLQLAVLCAALLLATGDAKKKLYGSRDAQDGQFPYAVMHVARSRRGYHTCSGGIIGQEWVLLAAHCVNKDLPPRNHIVVAGKANLTAYAQARYRGMSFAANVDETAFDLQERRASAVHYHPFYSRGGNNDIGLLRTDRPFVFGPRVSAIAIGREPFVARSDCSLVGYGVVESEVRRYVLQYIEGMPALPARQCRHQRFRDVICLADRSRGICHGDSGGPLVCGGVARGVASHGTSRVKGCGQGTIEQYFCDVERNTQWLDPVLANSG